MLYGVVDTVLTGHASATDLAAMGLGTGVCLREPAGRDQRPQPHHRPASRWAAPRGHRRELRAGLVAGAAALHSGRSLSRLPQPPPPLRPGPTPRRAL